MYGQVRRHRHDVQRVQVVQILTSLMSHCVLSVLNGPAAFTTDPGGCDSVVYQLFRIVIAWVLELQRKQCRNRVGIVFSFGSVRDTPHVPAHTDVDTGTHRRHSHTADTHTNTDTHPHRHTHTARTPNQMNNEKSLQ